MGAPRLELGTSALSGLRSNQLSYAPARCKQVILNAAGRLRKASQQQFGFEFPMINRPKIPFTGSMQVGTRVRQFGWHSPKWQYTVYIRLQPDQFRSSANGDLLHPP